MAKFAPSVVGPLAVKQETSMLRTSKTSTKKAAPKAAPKLVAVLKNGHTDAELDQMEDHWVNHQGPRLTLADVIAIERAKQNPQDAQ